MDKVQEELLEKETELTEKEGQWENEKLKLTEKSSKSDTKLTELQALIENLTKQNESMKTEISTKSKIQIQQLETENE